MALPLGNASHVPTSGTIVPIPGTATGEYGTIRFAPIKNGWEIRCEPHVRARLKRVFPRAPQHAADTILISDTPENCRDLLWFIERYPMTIEPRAQMEASAQRHVDTERRIHALLTQGAVGAKPITLAKPPREYQTFAANMLDVVEGLLLADDVGLGKSVSSICSLVKPEYRPAVVVCPTHLPKQWANMIAEFAPELTTHIVKKGMPYPITEVRRGADDKVAWNGTLPDVLLINYHKLHGWAETIAGFARFVVFDEAQALHSPGTQIYQAAKYIADRARRRLCLTASPIHNYGAEFFYVLDVVRPGALGERDDFVREWCSQVWSNGRDKSRLRDPEQFGGYLRREGLMLRRTRKDVGRELPDVTKVVHTVDADPKALRAIKSTAVELAQRILGGAPEQERGERMRAAGEFDRLMRQATGIAKAAPVAEFAKMLLESEEKIVMFGWHRNVYDIWLAALKEYKPVLYTGTESPTQKQAALDAFITGESRILIISLRSGAGIDGLQYVDGCRVVLFGEVDWSPAVHMQCVGRVHRDGQDEPVTAYFVVSDAPDSADPIMLQVLGIKREQSEGVLNPDHALTERADVGEQNLKLLARKFLQSQGVAVNDGEAAPTADECTESST